MADQFFVYFRLTPKGIKYFVSRDLSPLGTKKKLLLRSDPRSEAANALLSAMIGTTKAMCGRQIPRPDLAELTDRTRKMMKGLWGIEDLTFLPEQGVYGPRVLVKFKEGE